LSRLFKQEVCSQNVLFAILETTHHLCQ
jgi:hypothetical protein